MGKGSETRVGKKKKIRNDGFVNAFSGQGLRSRDPFKTYSVDADLPLTDDEIDNLYTYNGIAKKVIEVPADEATAKGFTLMDGADEVDKTSIVLSALEDIKWKNVFSEALAWERAMGGSAILIWANDGKPFSEPLDVKKADKIEKLEVYSKQDIQLTGLYYSDPTNPNYGKPYLYTLINEWGTAVPVHESRLLVFKGGRISKAKRRERDGWGSTVFDSIKEKLVQYETSLSLSLAALSRLSQSVLKLNGLADVLSNPDGDELVRKRLQVIDMARHLLNTIAIDTADDYQQHQISLGGIATIEEEFECAISAACNIPVTILFGRSPAGMNATGRSDFEQYYNMVQHIQTRNLEPQLLRLIEIMGQIYNWSLPEKYTINFKPLWSLTEQEKASIQQTKVSTDVSKVNAVNTLVSSEIITKEEARQILKEVIKRGEQ